MNGRLTTFLCWCLMAAVFVAGTVVLAMFLTIAGRPPQEIAGAIGFMVAAVVVVHVVPPLIAESRRYLNRP